MSRISTLTLLIALGFSASAYAAPANSPAQALHGDYSTLNTDDDEIRALDHQRDEALRTKNAAAAQQIQAKIDQLRAARKNVQQDIGKEHAAIEQQKLTEEQKCARDPVCAAKKKHEALEGQLQGAERQLAGDEAAAARIEHDKAAIAQLRAELK